MQAHNRQHRDGFTLIELLVVISIIALLISILLPALRKARESAITMQCLTQVRQITVGSNAYAADEDGYFPSRIKSQPATPAGTAFQPHFMQLQGADPVKAFDLNREFIFPYLGNQSLRDKLMFCPGPASEYLYPSRTGYGVHTDPVQNNRLVGYQYLNVRFSGQARPSQPDYEDYDDELTRNTARGWMPLWGDMTMRTSLGAILSHEYPLVFPAQQFENPGGNFANADGSGRWYSTSELEPYIGSTNVYYRPDIDHSYTLND